MAFITLVTIIVVFWKFVCYGNACNEFVSETIYWAPHFALKEIVVWEDITGLSKNLSLFISLRKSIICFFFQVFLLKFSKKWDSQLKVKPRNGIPDKDLFCRKKIVDFFIQKLFKAKNEDLFFLIFESYLRWPLKIKQKNFAFTRVYHKQCILRNLVAFLTTTII